MTDYRLANLLACARERPHLWYSHAAYELAVALGDTAAADEMRERAQGYVPEGVVRMRTGPAEIMQLVMFEEAA